VDWRGVDVVGVAFGHFKFNSVVQEGVNVDVAVALGYVVAGYARPLREVGGGLRGSD
jgi:hypothetical protein